MERCCCACASKQCTHSSCNLRPTSGWRGFLVNCGSAISAGWHAGGSCFCRHARASSAATCAFCNLTRWRRLATCESRINPEEQDRVASGSESCCRNYCTGHRTGIAQDVPSRSIVPYGSFSLCSLECFPCSCSSCPSLCWRAQPHWQRHRATDQYRACRRPIIVVVGCSCIAHGRWRQPIRCACA